MARRRKHHILATLFGIAILGYIGVQYARGWWVENRAHFLGDITGRVLSFPALAWLVTAALAVVLLRAWSDRAPARRVPSNVTMADLDAPRGVRVDGSALEELTAQLIIRDGGSVRRCGGSGDGGVDVAGTDAAGRSLVVQCKQYNVRESIPPSMVRELIGAARLRQADVAMFVTSAGSFSAQARAEAKAGGVVLVDHHRLAGWRAGGHLPELGSPRTPWRDRAKTVAAYAAQARARWSR